MRQSGGGYPDPEPRGLLKPEEAEKAFALELLQPRPELRRWVEFYWNVSWDLGDRVFVQTVVTNPTVEVSFEHDPGTNGSGFFLIVTGVAPRSYQRRLTGRADAFAVHFRPAQFRPWWGSGVSALTGKALRIGGGDRPWEAESAALLPGILDRPLEERARLMDEVLMDHRPPEDPVADEIQRIVEASRSDRSLWTAEAMAGRRAVTVRTNQRQFLEYVGVGPKWVAMRHRIQTAVGMLDAERAAGTRHDLTRLALDLGYYDLAHFSREYRDLIGESPDRYRS
jgi:AraC-like DNA-binding protein